MTKVEINYQNWAENAVAFIKENGLEREFKDWCGGFPCPVHSRRHTVRPAVADPENLKPIHVRLLRRGTKSKYIPLDDDMMIGVGQIAALGELERAGLVKITDDELPPGPPSMRPREITEAGRKALEGNAFPKPKQ